MLHQHQSLRHGCGEIVKGVTLPIPNVLQRRRRKLRWWPIESSGEFRLDQYRVEEWGWGVRWVHGPALSSGDGRRFPGVGGEVPSGGAQSNRQLLGGTEAIPKFR
jgi:hypothetical protein